MIKDKKKTKYSRIQLDSQQVLDGMMAFFDTLDENKIGIDEITIHITNEVTGKSKKINLFKDFIKFANKYR